MKRKLITSITSLMLLLSVVVVANVDAHSVTVGDSSRQEWFEEAFKGDSSRRNAVPSDSNVGVIARNNAGQGEFVWNDTLRDQRVIATTTVSREADLSWFAITGDTNNIYFIAKMDRITGVTNNPSPEVMIAIDTNQSGGTTALPDNVATNVNSAAAWEYVIQTKFTPSNAAAVPKLWKPAQSTCTGCEAQLVGASNGTLPGSFIEIKVPWSNFTGGMPTPATGWRFTVGTFYHTHVLPTDGNPSALIDAISLQTTTAEVANGTIDHYFDLHFDPKGEVFAPLLISEFQANPLGSNDDTTSLGSEWIEIYNPPTNNVTVNLGEYKIGDAAKRGGSAEAMLQFPSKTLNPGDVVVVARDKTKVTGIPAGVTVYNYSQLSVYSSWSSGSTLGLANDRDQLVLLDGRDTIVDLVDYTTPGNLNPDFPGIVPITVPATGVPEGNDVSYERCPATRDTNNNPTDFLLHSPASGSAPTPGAPCPAATGVDLTISKTAQESQVQPGATVVYFLNWSNNGNAALPSVVISDTLPPEITFDSANPPPSSTSGQTQTWNIPTSGTNISGTITLTGTIDASAPENTPLVNTAGIHLPSGSGFSESNLTNNVASAAVSVIRPDLGVSSTWPSAAIAGSDFTYTITYNNTGMSDASGVVLVDTLPAGVTVISAPGASQSGNTLTWTIGTLAAGQGGTKTVQLRLAGNLAEGTQLQNTITISGTPADAPSATANNTETKTLTVAIDRPNLGVSSTWPSAAQPGSQFTYTITYRNTGVGDAMDVHVTDTLPAGVTLVSQTGAGTSFSQSGNTLTWTIASLPAGQSGTITVRVMLSGTAGSGTSRTNVITITGSPLDDAAMTGDNSESKVLQVGNFSVYLPVLIK